MPVKGLTDRQSIEARYPILGKLRKGGEKRKNRPGEDLAYFRFTGEGPRFEEIERIFYQKFGPKPDRIRVILPYGTVEESFPTWREKWRGTRARILDHRCDGEKTVLLRREDGSYSKAAEDCPGGCSLVGRLNVVIPELLAAGLVGTVTVETHGTWDCVNITSTLAQAEKQAARYGGTLEGMDCIVYRSHEQVKTPEGLPVMKWLVRIALTSEWAQGLLVAAKNQAVELMGGPQVMLESGNDEPVEAEVIDAPPAEAEVASKPEAPATPSEFDPIDCDNFAEMAAAATWELGFEHSKHVVNTLKKITGGDSNGLSYADMWAMLADHQAAKENEDTDEEATE